MLHVDERQMPAVWRCPRHAHQRKQTARLFLARAVRDLLCGLVRDPLSHRITHSDPVRLVDRDPQSDCRQRLFLALQTLVFPLAQNLLLPRLRKQFQSVARSVL